MASFAGEIWLVDEPSARLSGLIEIDAGCIRIVVDGQEVASWARAKVRFSEAGTCFELLADGATICFAPAAPALFREELFPGSVTTATSRFRAALAGAARQRRWSERSPWIATAVAIAVVLIAVSTAGQSGEPRVRTTKTTPPTTTLAVLAEEAAIVASVTDGDTIRVVLADGSNEPVRLIGIDAPEPNDPLGPEARALLHSLVSGQSVRLVPDVSDRDGFDRLLRYVYVGDLFVNEAMVGSGLAEARRYEPDTHMADVLEEAERRAETTTSTGASTTTAATNTTTASTTTILTTTTTPPTTAAPTTTAPPVTTTAAPVASCHGSYQGECLTPGIGDYDCASGSGNGPNYVYGTVQVVGYDEFDLDGDGDGLGCE